MREVDGYTAKPREYLPLLWIVFAALLGVALLCGAAVLGVNDINQASLAGTPDVGVVDFFVNNLNTVVAETVVAFSDIVAAPVLTETSQPDSIPVTGASLTPSEAPIATSTFFFYTKTPPRPTITFTPSPTRTPTFTRTPTATATDTATATSTFTSTPTNTPTATSTNTPTSTPTDTPTPTPTDTNTPTPIPTSTNTPVDTPTPTDTIAAPVGP